jgi:hypothetical protein
MPLLVSPIILQQMFEKMFLFFDPNLPKEVGQVDVTLKFPEKA